MQFTQILAQIGQTTLTALLSILVLFLLAKLMGTKQVSQMTMFDYVVGITIGSVAAELATELEEPAKPLTALIIYGIMAVLISILTNKSIKARAVVTGKPLVLLENGVIYRKNLKKARLDLNEFLTYCRIGGWFDLNQLQSAEAIYGRGTLKRSSFWEDESLANFWGEDRFKHPSCVTDSILKTEKREVGKGDSVITVYAYGYRRMQRLTYVSVWGGDGRSHQVPVYRDEYISVTGQGSIRIREDIDFEDSAISQRERLDHINTLLDSANLNIYRRHIAPKV